MWYHRNSIFASLFALVMLVASSSVAADDVVVVHPSSIDIENGTLNYGELAFLTKSDLDTYDIDSSPNTDANSNNYTTVWTAAAIVDSPSEVSSIRVEIAGHYSQPSVTQKVSLYNYATSSWHNFDTSLVGNEVDEVIILNVDQDYVASDGTLKVRIMGLRDESFTSWANLITWTVAYGDADLPSPHHSVIFNDATGLSVVEGSFDDWASKTPFGEDAEDIHEPNSPLDWQKAWIAHNGGFFWFAYTNYGDVNQSWGQTIYLDTDINSSTGWQSGLAIGADYVIQSNMVYKYVGNNAGTKWEWELVRAISYGGFSGGAEFRFLRNDIGNPEIMYVAYVGSNEPYGGDAEDLFPDGVYSSNGTQYFVYTTNESLATNRNNIQTDGENSAPVAEDIVVQAVEFEPVEFTVSAIDADGDELTYTIVSGDGTLEGDGPSYSFIPDLGGTTYYFTYKAFDGTQYSNEATISIETNFFDIPLLDVVDLYFEVASDESVEVNIGPDDPFVTYFVDDPMFGTFAGDAPNLIYTPDMCCEEEFIYYSTETVEGFIFISVLGSNTNSSESNYNDNIVIDGSSDEWVTDWKTGFGNFDELNPAEIDGARLAHNQTSFYINHTSGISLLADVDEKAYFVYLDTDESASTGYRGFREIGAEFMVQGGSLYQYNGDGISFDWSYLGDIERAISGQQAELKIDRFAIGNPVSLNVVFVADNLIPEVGGGIVYVFPDGGYDDVFGFSENFFTYTFGDAAIAQDTLSFDAAHAEPVEGLSSLFQNPRQPSIDPLNVESTVTDIDQVEQAGNTTTIESAGNNTGGNSGGGSTDMIWLIALFGLIGIRRVRRCAPC